MKKYDPSRNFLLGPYRDLWIRQLDQWQSSRFAERLWSRDPTLWFKEKRPEIENRLGWLDLPLRAEERQGLYQEFARILHHQDRIHSVVLCGMGGSSLSCEMWKHMYPPGSTNPALYICDTIHPEAVRRLSNDLNEADTLFIISSKSGTTMETRVLFEYFWERSSYLRKGDRFVAITDAGTPLEKLARERGFRRTFIAPSDVGGRFSALSEFGLVPAAVIGAPLEKIIGSAREMAELCSPHIPVHQNPGLQLGAALGVLSNLGKNKITLHVPPSYQGFPEWVEQLLAESTGKEGKGLVPIIDEPYLGPHNYRKDRVFVIYGDSEWGMGEAEIDQLVEAKHPMIVYPNPDPLSVGGEIFRWEIAIAAAGAVMRIHPFNQPDVQSAKDLAKKYVELIKTGVIHWDGPVTVSIENDAEVRRVLSQLQNVEPEGYIAVQAFLPPFPEVLESLNSLRITLTSNTGSPVLVGLGPRYLHSTGQLHKGGPSSGRFLQLIGGELESLRVENGKTDMSLLFLAQAEGDAMALLQRGRPVYRIQLGPAVERNLNKLIQIAAED